MASLTLGPVITAIFCCLPLFSGRNTGEETQRALLLDTVTRNGAAADDHLAHRSPVTNQMQNSVHVAAPSLSSFLYASARRAVFDRLCCYETRLLIRTSTSSRRGDHGPRHGREWTTLWRVYCPVGPQWAWVWCGSFQVTPAASSASVASPKASLRLTSTKPRRSKRRRLAALSKPILAS